MKVIFSLAQKALRTHGNGKMAFKPSVLFLVLLFTLMQGCTSRFGKNADSTLVDAISGTAQKPAFIPISSNQSSSTSSSQSSTSLDTVAGQTISFQVEVMGSNGYPMFNYNGPVLLDLLYLGDSVPDDDAPLALLTGTYKVNAVKGVATFTDLKIFRAARFAFRASIDSGPLGTSSTFVVKPAAPAKLAVLDQPVTATAGVPLTTQVGQQAPVQFLVEDQYGNVAYSSTAPITVSLGSGSPQGGAFANTSTVTLASQSGIATFPNLILDQAGSYTLVANSGSLQNVTTDKFDVIPGVAAGLSFNAPPAPTGTAGVALQSATAGTPVEVAVVDKFGNIVNSNNPVTIALSNTSPAGASLGNSTVTVTPTAGVAAFNNLTLTLAGKAYSLVASSNGLTSATSTPFDVNAASPALLKFAAMVPDFKAGMVPNPAVAVDIEDAFGNIVTNATNPVSLTTTLGGMTQGSPVSATPANGVATFSTFTINKAGSGYQLTAASTGLTSATSNTFNVTPGPAAKLAWNVEPATSTAGSILNPGPLTVLVEDAFGNTVTTATSTVNVALGSNPGRASLSGTSTSSAVNGQATFPNLSVNKSGSGYTLVATSFGLSSATSTSFDVNPAAPVYNVNCAGDGTTDDLTCIQNTLNQAARSSSSIVAFVAGKTYLVSNALVLSSGMTLQGNQATLLSNKNNAPVLEVHGSNIVIDGLQINDAVTNSGAGVDFVTDNSVTSISNVVIQNSTFMGQNSTAVDINARGVSDVTVTNNKFMSVNYGVLMDSVAYDLKNVQVTTNTISNVYGDGVAINDPIFNTGGTGVVGKSATNITISGNTITAPNSTTAAAGFCVEVTGATFVTVSNNSLSNCEFQGVHLEDQAENITISNNSISNIAGNSSVGWVGSTDGIWLDQSHQITISGNTISNVHDVGIDLNYDKNVATDFDSGVSIQNNTISGSGLYGIRIGGLTNENVNTSITGNTVMTSGTADLNLTDNPAGVTQSNNMFQ